MNLFVEAGRLFCLLSSTFMTMRDVDVTIRDVDITIAGFQCHAIQNRSK